MKDILLFKDNQIPLATCIYNLAINSETRPLLISIGGKSGVGKTEIATLVKNKLNDSMLYTKVISQDSYYLKGHESHRVDTDCESVGRDELCWTSIKNGIMNLMNSGIYDVVILEGLYACSYPSDLKVYISQSYDDSYEFRRDRGKENPDSNHRQMVLRCEAEEVRKTKEGSIILTYDMGESIYPEGHE